jgi:hypothetical protein
MCSPAPMVVCSSRMTAQAPSTVSTMPANSPRLDGSRCAWLAMPRSPGTPDPGPGRRPQCAANDQSAFWSAVRSEGGWSELENRCSRKHGTGDTLSGRLSLPGGAIGPARTWWGLCMVTFGTLRKLWYNVYTFSFLRRTRSGATWSPYLVQVVLVVLTRVQVLLPYTSIVSLPGHTWIRRYCRRSLARCFP